MADKVTVYDMRRLFETREEQRSRELRRIAFLEQRGVATWDDLARGHRLQREAVNEEFNRRERKGGSDG